MKFGFIAKHRAIWPAECFCGALGVSRGGFYAWLARPRNQRSRSNEELTARVRRSFLASDRTYDARRVWHELLTPCQPNQGQAILEYFQSLSGPGMTPDELADLQIHLQPPGTHTTLLAELAGPPPA